MSNHILPSTEGLGAFRFQNIGVTVLNDDHKHNFNHLNAFCSPNSQLFIRLLNINNYTLLSTWAAASVSVFCLGSCLWAPVHLHAMHLLHLSPPLAGKFHLTHLHLYSHKQSVFHVFAASQAHGHNFPDRKDSFRHASWSQRFLKPRVSDWMFRLQWNWNIVLCFCCTVYLTVSGVLPFCLCVCFWLNSLLRKSSSLLSRKGNISCRTVFAWSMSVYVYLGFFCLLHPRFLFSPTHLRPTMSRGHLSPC